MSEFIENVKQLLIERPEALYELMIGTSVYNDDPVENKPTTRDEVMEHNLASKYVKFVSKYGFDVTEVREGNRFYLAHPENFNKWVLNGCLGLDSGPVDAYIAKFPLGTHN